MTPPDNVGTIRMNMVVHLELTDEDVTALASEHGLDVEDVRAVVSAWVAKRRFTRDELRDQLEATRHTLDRAQATWIATEAALDDIPANTHSTEAADRRLAVCRATMRGALGMGADEDGTDAEARLARRTAAVLVEALARLGVGDDGLAEAIIDAVLADARVNERAPEIVMPIIDAIMPALAEALPHLLNTEREPE